MDIEDKKRRIKKFNGEEFIAIQSIGGWYFIKHSFMPFCKKYKIKKHKFDREYWIKVVDFRLFHDIIEMDGEYN